MYAIDNKLLWDSHTYIYTHICMQNSLETNLPYVISKVHCRQRHQETIPYCDIVHIKLLIDYASVVYSLLWCLCMKQSTSDSQILSLAQLRQLHKVDCDRKLLRGEQNERDGAVFE